MKIIAQELIELDSRTSAWSCVFEFDIPRRAKRVDAIVVTSATLFVLEFKSAAQATRGDQRQVEDYACELADFHTGSHSHRIYPIVVPLGYKSLSQEGQQQFINAQVQSVTVAAPGQIPTLLRSLTDAADFNAANGDAASRWLESPYCPTPTIVEAAAHLYANHKVEEIARSEASAKNIRETLSAISEAVHNARTQRRKVVCFVTGVPGAGKTLAGLNAVCSDEIRGKGIESVFLSGNGPLVKVLSEALARDERDRSQLSIKEARRRSGKFIQGVHSFIDHYSDRDDAPVDHVVVFDEAQRAWNKEHAHRKFDRETSEPVTMFKILNRHQNWAALVCLVGIGQEINTGEAGLREWGRALECDYAHWDAVVSRELMNGDDSAVGQTLFGKNVPTNVRSDARLHLDVPIRAFRGTQVANWVDAVLEENAERAKLATTQLKKFDIKLTRSLTTAREWLRANTRGNRRSGLVASSGGKRLRRFGISVDAKIDVEQWFLNTADDVRSSTYLELLATEFDIQGLELDRVGVCWDADLRVMGDKWIYRKFRGSGWQTIRKSDDITYLKNKYRVLLTRAREGMVIWVPSGDSEDEFSLPEFYDATAGFLLECGATLID